MSSFGEKLRAIRSNPLLAIDYCLYRVGFGTAATAFGGRLRASSYSELLTARNLALSAQELKLIEMLPERGNIFDVGAHVGIWTVPLALGRPNAQIHSFEGAPTTFRQLQKNIVYNRLTNVRAVNAAVCDSSKSVTFQVPENASVFGRISSSGNSIGRYDRVSEVRISGVSLADYCNSRNVKSIELLKIDVEGAEVDVLRGLFSMLLRHAVHLIWMEIDEVNQLDSNHSISELASLMEECRYGIYRLSDPENPVDIRVKHEANMLAKPL